MPSIGMAHGLARPSYQGKCLVELGGGGACG